MLGVVYAFLLIPMGIDVGVNLGRSFSRISVFLSTEKRRCPPSQAKPHSKQLRSPPNAHSPTPRAFARAVSDD